MLLFIFLAMLYFSGQFNIKRLIIIKNKLIMQTMYMLNFIYIKYKEIKEYCFTTNKFTIDNAENIWRRDNTESIKYSFKNKKYRLLTTVDNITFPPYTLLEIDDKISSSNFGCVPSSDNIISAEVIYNVEGEDKTKECLNIIQELSGPLGDFYINTNNRVLASNLKKYISDILQVDNIQNIVIMNSMGDEIDLLKSLF